MVLAITLSFNSCSKDNLSIEESLEDSVWKGKTIVISTTKQNCSLSQIDRFAFYELDITHFEIDCLKNKLYLYYKYGEM